MSCKLPLKCTWICCWKLERIVKNILWNRFSGDVCYNIYNIKCLSDYHCFTDSLRININEFDDKNFLFIFPDFYLISWHDSCAGRITKYLIAKETLSFPGSANFPRIFFRSNRNILKQKIAESVLTFSSDTLTNEEHSISV